MLEENSERVGQGETSRRRHRQTEEGIGGTIAYGTPQSDDTGKEAFVY